MLSTAEIKKFIEEDKLSEKKRLAGVGQKYYEAEHDILKSRLFYWNENDDLVEDTYRSNIRISHPFFTELSDQLSSYMLSFTENPIRAKKKAEGLQDHLDTYFGDEFWAEISELLTGAYNKGFEYIYGFKNAENRLEFQCADSMGVVEVPAKYASDKKDHKIHHYLDTELTKKGIVTVTRIEDWDDKEVHYYVQHSEGGKIEIDKSVEINPRPHVVFTKKGQKMGYGLGYIPFWRLDYNKKQFSGLKPIKDIIDDYDLHACSLSNNLADFDTPLHVVSGYEGDDMSKLQTNLKTKKIIGVDSEGDVQVRTVDIPYQARKEKLDIDEKNIYKFGMGLNLAGLKDTSATTNVLIKAMYSLLDLKADKFEIRLKKLLKEIIKVVLEEINKEMKTDYKLTDIEFNFERSVMTNETENISNAKTEAEIKQMEINTILNAAAYIGDEEVLRLMCDCLDIDFEEIKSELEKRQEEQNLNDAQNALNNVVPEDEPNLEGVQQ